MIVIERERLARLKREVERRLDGFLPPARREPALLHRAMRYAVFSGGKRLRPIIMLAVGDALGVARARLMLQTALGASRRHFVFEEQSVFPLVESALESETLAGLAATWMERLEPQPVG